jgi:UDP-N-acetylglucosamine 4,6-dehydratase
MTFFKDSSILITGGTGSFGNAFIDYALQHLDFRRIIIFSRDELKQYEMKSKYQNDQRLRFFIGDIRESSRLDRAFSGVDFIIHAAALKQVDTAEYNPYEFVKTNVLGSQNVIDAAINNKVKKVVALSTDKASSPVNLYGATKLTADKLFISGNHYSGSSGTNFSVVRYGNVINSRGSVIPRLKQLKSEGKPFTVTNMSMTRFWLTLDLAIELVLKAFELSSGGELYVPKIPSLQIGDLVKAIDPEWPVELMGIRPGEKLHEEMISLDEGRRTIDSGNHYIVFPESQSEKLATRNLVPQGFRYSSDTNPHFMTLAEMGMLL